MATKFSNDREWDGDSCEKIAFQSTLTDSYFHVAVLNKDVQKNIINRFIDFYVEGKIPDDLNAADLVLAVVSIMPEDALYEDVLFIHFVEYNKMGTLFKVPIEDIEIAENYKPKWAIFQDNPNDIKEVGKEDNKAEESKSQEYSDEEKQFIKNFGESTIDEHDIIIPNSNTVNDRNIILCEKRKLQSDENSNRDINDKESDSNSQNKQVEQSPQKNQEEDNAGTKRNLINEQDNSTLRDNFNDTAIKFPENKSIVEDEKRLYEKFSKKILSFKKQTWLSGANEPEKTNIDFGPINKEAFSSSCNNVLGDWNVSEQARAALKYFFGVVALILMRSMTKSFKHIAYAFSASKFLSHVEYVNQFTGHLFQYSIPHIKCLESSYEIFRQRKANARIMLAKIVFHCAARNRRLEFDDPSVMGVFKNMLLVHIADYGFELVTMVQTIQNMVGDRSFNILIDFTLCEVTIDSWERVKTFLSTYSRSDADISRRWARAIDDTYFKNLSCKNNYPLAVILAVFNEKIFRNTGIWNSKWLKEGKDLEIYKELGSKMYKSFFDKTNDVH